MSAIDIVCVTYRHEPKLETFLNAMLSQTSLQFRLTIIHDGPDAEFDEVAKRYATHHPALMRFLSTNERHNDYGHTLRDVGIGLAEHEWLLLTNGDNYYCPVFVDSMLSAAAQGNAEFILCDMLHSHDKPGGRPQGRYRYFDTAPSRYSIDMGCFMVKTHIAKRVGFRDKTHDGDATYVGDLIATGEVKNVQKVAAALLVHN
ncbi:glycosyltransferase family 2 protein [Candidatus Burkholderia verschuerenii]|nr:glycosyltransferase family A protein [Candidatus Burkholderia verschuerenii]